MGRIFPELFTEGFTIIFTLRKHSFSSFFVENSPLEIHNGGKGEIQRVVPSNPAHKVTKPAHKVTKPTHKVTKPAHKVTKPAHKVTKPAHKVTKPAQESEKEKEKQHYTYGIPWRE